MHINIVPNACLLWLTVTPTASRPGHLNGLWTAGLPHITLSSAEAPAGYPHQNINNRKNRKRAGDDGKRETAGALSLLSSPFPSCPARSLFLSPQPPHNTKSLPTTQRGLCGGESLEHISNFKDTVFLRQLRMRDPGL